MRPLDQHPTFHNFATNEPPPGPDKALVDQHIAFSGAIGALNDSLRKLDRLLTETVAEKTTIDELLLREREQGCRLADEIGICQQIAEGTFTKEPRPDVSDFGYYRESPQFHDYTPAQLAVRNLLLERNDADEKITTLTRAIQGGVNLLDAEKKEHAATQKVLDMRLAALMVTGFTFSSHWEC
jgi:hypothetical protein